MGTESRESTGKDEIKGNYLESSRTSMKAHQFASVRGKGDIERNTSFILAKDQR